MDRVKKKLHFIILRKIRGPAIHTFFLMEILSSNNCLVGSSAGLFCLRLLVFDLSRFDGPVVSVVTHKRTQVCHSSVDSSISSCCTSFDLGDVHFLVEEGVQIQ